MPTSQQVLIIGGGIAGLACARELLAQGIACQVVEASDAVGGRMASDEVDGFILDRGFQVFLTAYPAAQRVLDYEKLALCRFEPGALVRYAGKFRRLADPWRRPQHLLATVLSPVATLFDKFRIAKFRRHAAAGDLVELYDRAEKTTIDLLRRRGFSEQIVDRFFRPFLGGVFLDHELQTSSRMCEFVFRMFSLGDAALPGGGMRAIPLQLANAFPAGTIRTGCTVKSLDAHGAVLKTGERISATAVVVATEGPVAATLLGNRSLTCDRRPSPGRSVSCVYFAADKPPLSEPILVLNGDGKGPINNLCVPSQVAPSYAPDGQSLVSATVLGTSADSSALEHDVRKQLRQWFGAAVDQWRHLQTYAIPFALPSQAPPALNPVVKAARVADGLFQCGDYCDTASINGAMASGRRAADAAVEYLNRGSTATSPQPPR